MALFENFAPYKFKVIAHLNKSISVFEEIGNKIAAKNIKAFINDFDNMRYNLTVVGSLKRGKSTLINTLMERKNDDISPVSFEVCTSAIIKYLDKELIKDGEKKEKAVVFFDGGQAPIDIPLERLRSYVTETENPKNVKKVRSIEVYGDFPEWSKAVTLVDSPGQNAVYNYHDTLLTDFLPYTDAIIFLIAADLPIDGGDLKLLKELNKDQQRKVFYVITKVDSLEHPEDLKDIEQRVFSVLGENELNCEKLYKVSARPVFKALKNGVTGVELNELKAQNGIEELEKDLEQFIINNSKQTDIVKKRVASILEEVQNNCRSYSDNMGMVLSKKNFDVNALASEKATLDDKNEELRKNSAKALRKFEREWERVLAATVRKFTAKAPAIDNLITDRLKKSGLVGIIAQSFKLRSLVKNTIYSEFNPILMELEDKLTDVANKLDEELQEEVSVYVKKSRGMDIITKGAGIAGSAAIVATVSSQYSAAAAALSAASGSFASWTGALQTLHKAEAVNAGNGWIPKIWNCLLGTGNARDVTNATATVSSAGVGAIGATVSCICSVAMNIAVVWVVQKVVEMGLSSFQESRIPNISDEIIKEIEENLLKSLEESKKAIIDDYNQKIEDFITENDERIEEITELLDDQNSDSRLKLEENLNKVNELLPVGDELISSIPAAID